MTKRIDPASLRYRVAGHEYRIGTRVMTDRGRATISAFDPGSETELLVLVDNDPQEYWVSWRDVEPIAEAQPAQ